MVLLVEPGTRRERDELSIAADAGPETRAVSLLTTGAGCADAVDRPSRDRKSFVIKCTKRQRAYKTTPYIG